MEKSRSEIGFLKAWGFLPFFGLEKTLWISPSKGGFLPATPQQLGEKRQCGVPDLRTHALGS